MPDSHYPSVDIQFIKDQIIATGKLEPDGIIQFGQTTTFVVAGKQAIYKRSILIRNIGDDQICYEHATGLAIKFAFIGILMDWFEANRNWKEGGYIVVPQRISSQ